VRDRDERLSKSLRGSQQRSEIRARRQPLVDTQLRPRRPRDRRGGLTRAEKRAREDDGRRDRREPLPELPRLLAAGRRQRAQLVRLPGSRFCMPDEEEAHDVQDRTSGRLCTLLA